MMMSGGKKLAMMIIKNAGGKTEEEKKNADFIDKDGKKKPDVSIEIEKDIDNKDGMEAAMAKFIAAVHSKNPSKAAEAMSEYMACCDEEEMDYSTEPSEKV